MDKWFKSFIIIINIIKHFFNWFRIFMRRIMVHIQDETELTPDSNGDYEPVCEKCKERIKKL